MSIVCGTGNWSGPLPGDPDNNSVLRATPAFGGIDVSWSYPTTNPHAVAHTLLYRSVLGNFDNAMNIAVVAGGFYYDKLDTGITYYYWIKIVSVNGTVGEPIGPASATARPLIADLITQLTGQIDDGMLAQSLKTEVDRITLNYDELTGEISNRIAANTALSAALSQVQSGLTQAMAFIGEEITTRIDGDNALVTAVNSIAAANQNNLALIQQEQTVRVNSDSALATQINTVATATANNAAAIITEQTTRSNQNSALSTLITDVSAATNANAAAVSNEITARTNADSALAEQITTVQSTLGSSISSVQTSMQTQINSVTGELDAIYTAKVDVNGMVGGFGIYGTANAVEAGFDVDKFWIGRTNGDKRKPFIIEGGVVYINDAAINKLTFSKLRDESGSFIVENGKLKANYLQVNEIMGGAFTGFVFPPAGQQGFYLGPGGLLLGNINNGKYFAVADSGDIYAPGFSVVNGVLTVDQLNVIKTSNINPNSVTVSNSASGTAPVFTLSIPANQTMTVITTISCPGGGEWEPQFGGATIATIVNGSVSSVPMSLLTYDTGAEINSTRKSALSSCVMRRDVITAGGAGTVITISGSASAHNFAGVCTLVAIGTLR